MLTPYTPPPDVSAGNAPRVFPGYMARVAAGIFALLFVAVALLTVLRIWIASTKQPGVAEPISILIGSGIWLAIHGASATFFWRLGSHYLYPDTHGFGVLDRQQAVSILRRHQDMDLSQVDSANHLYHGSSLRELLRTYHTMDRDKHPARLAALLLAMRTHVARVSK